MKKLFAILISALMLLTCFTLPVTKENAEADAADASSLNDALNLIPNTLSFSTDTNYPWTVEEDHAVSGNGGVSSSTSSVWTSFTAQAGDVIQFDWISMGEGSDEQDWDGLRVYLDGTKILHKGAAHSVWEHYQQVVSAGTHELRFTYKKDSSVNSDFDCAKIDNVYAGSPITPNTINVSPIVLQQGRSESVSYTVLPDYAYDKSVTFSTADASIASVDASGSVLGVGVGTTTVTVTSVSDPSVSGTATVSITPSSGAAELFGFCLYDINNTMLNGNFVSFYADSPSVVTPRHSFDRAVYAGAFAGGNIYGFIYDSNGTDTRFFVMDAETYEVRFPGANYAPGMMAMAFNHADGTMYGISGHAQAKLVSIDISTGYVTEIAAISGLSGSPMTLAIDLEGTAYVLEENSSSAKLYTLDLASGAAALRGETGASLAYIQSMTYDFASNKIYWAQTFDAEKTGLYTIDPATMEVEPLGRIGAAGMEITGLFIKNDIPVDTTPAEVTVTFYDNVGAQVLEERSVPIGSVLDPSAFPAAPSHPGFTFLNWDYAAGTPIYRDTTINTRYYDPNATTAVIVLNVPEDHWGDGSGYQMLIDADAAAYGVQIPSSGSVFYSGGNAPDSLYDAFEYKIPENADGMLNTQNVVVRNRIAIEIPAGTYDWCIVNPTPGDKIYIPSSYGNVHGRANDYTFEAGKTYTFTVTLDGSTDRVDLSVVLGGTTPQQPQGVLGDTDLNGSVTIADAVLALRHALGLITLEGQALANGDVDGSGGVAVADAVTILRKSMGLTDGF